MPSLRKHLLFSRPRGFSRRSCSLLRPRRWRWRSAPAAADGGGGGGGATTYIFPLQARTTTATDSAPVAAIRARTCSPGAAAKLVANRTRAAFRPSTVIARPATTSSSTATAPASTTPTCTSSRRRFPARAPRFAQGEKIGEVGDTGNASGCHLHFEKWTAPGYYEGGHASRTGDQGPQELGQVLLGPEASSPGLLLRLASQSMTPPDAHRCGNSAVPDAAPPLNLPLM